MNALVMSNRELIQRPAVSPIPAVLELGGALAGLAGGLAMTISAALLAGLYGYDRWVQVKAIASLVLGSSATASAGFAAGPVLIGLLIQLVVAALLGALFESVTRRMFRLPSDYGMPALTGLVFGLLLWLAAYFAVPALIPQLMVVAAPAFIILYIIYGMVTGLVHGVLRPQPYASTID
jgi:hypothetical protein